MLNFAIRLETLVKMQQAWFGKTKKYVLFFSSPRFQVYTEEATISELKRMRSATGRTRPLLARATTSAGGGGGATFGVLQHSHAGGRQQQEQHCQQHQGPASPTKFGPIGSGR